MEKKPQPKPKPQVGVFIPRRDWGDDISDYEEKEKQRLQDAVDQFGFMPRR